MALASEDLVKDFWMALWEVQYAARHDNVPGSLRDFGKMANHNFEIWFTQPGMLKAFASRVLSGPSDPRVAAAGLLRMNCARTAHACLRLLDLLESISDGKQQSC